jgi:multisubunit Na+/H+ antiporter MnhB subunit
MAHRARAGTLVRADLANLQWFAAAQTRLIQNGHLRTYLLTILLVADLPASRADTVACGSAHCTPAHRPRSFYEYALGGIIISGCVGAAVARSRVTALASVGVVGVGISVVFVLLGAPDLAMTQFLVDMLVVVVALLAMRLLPRMHPSERSRGLIKHARCGIAGSVGLLLAVLLLAVTATPLDRTIPISTKRRASPGIRQQHRERDPGRFPRDGYAGRDHRARGRRNRRPCAGAVSSHARRHRSAGILADPPDDHPVPVHAARSLLVVPAHARPRRALVAGSSAD